MDPDQQAKYYSRAWTFYRKALTILQKQQVPFLVRGTYALEQYTGIRRNTKDLDIFVMPKDCNRYLAPLLPNNALWSKPFSGSMQN